MIIIHSPLTVWYTLGMVNGTTKHAKTSASHLSEWIIPEMTGSQAWELHQ